jgi:hypothetical protein
MILLKHLHGFTWQSFRNALRNGGLPGARAAADANHQ